MLGELGNQKNHDRHLKSDRSGRRDLLCGTLVGNICPIAEGVDYAMVSQVRPAVRRTRHEACTVRVLACSGLLRVHGEFCDRDYLGLGKSVSRGFEVVVGLKR